MNDVDRSEASGEAAEGSHGPPPAHHANVPHVRPFAQIDPLPLARSFGFEIGPQTYRILVIHKDEGLAFVESIERRKEGGRFTGRRQGPDVERIGSGRGHTGLSKQVTRIRGGDDLTENNLINRGLSRLTRASEEVLAAKPFVETLSVS